MFFLTRPIIQCTEHHVFANAGVFMKGLKILPLHFSPVYGEAPSQVHLFSSSWKHSQHPSSVQL